MSFISAPQPDPNKGEKSQLLLEMEACVQERSTPALEQAECDAKSATDTESLRTLARLFCGPLWCSVVACGSNSEHYHSSTALNFTASRTTFRSYDFYHSSGA